MNQNIVINPLSKRQRGIYSEIVDPNNANELYPKDYIAGPSTSDFKSMISPNFTKAMSLARLETVKAELPNRNKEDDDRNILNKRIKSRQTMRQRMYQEANKIVTNVEPKVMQPFDPIPGQVPRKVAIDRRRKEFASYVLEELLEFVGVDYNKKHDQVEWLELEFFDDVSFDDNDNEEWMNRQTDEEGVFHPLMGRGLHVDNEGIKKYKQLIIEKYDDKTEKFEGKWKHSNKAFKLHRLYICLDSEDPRKYALRVANAFQQRIYSDSIIRYNNYIDNMPREDLSELDSEQKKRIENLAVGAPYWRGNDQKSKKLEESEINPQALTVEVNQDFSRTMNKIIFDQFLEEQRTSEYYPHHLKLPLKAEAKPAPYLGQMELERNKGVKLVVIEHNNPPVFEEPHDFADTFRNFCFYSLYIKEEVIKALQDIRLECNEVLKWEIFNTEESAMVFDVFNQFQQSKTSQLIYYLKGNWIEKMVKIIKQNFSEVGKGWFNMKETSKITYDFGKLKRFLTLIRLIMQDTLQSLVWDSYHKYEKFILSFIPEKVLIISSKEVQNIFKGQTADDAINEERKTLFQIDMLRTSKEDAFIYSAKDVNVFVAVVLQAFDKGLEEMSKIPDLERKILSDLYKSKGVDTPIKAPMKPREKPLDPDPNIRPRKYPDENKWLWDMYENLENTMKIAVQPLEQYLKAFDEFLPILRSTPEEYCKAIENEENPRDIELIKGEIGEVYKRKNQLKDQIPEEVHVSCFVIHCKDILLFLEDKQEEMAKQLKLLIAKRAKDATTTIFNEFSVIKDKINQDPQNIEQLTAVKEYMDNMPNELEKLKVDMNKCFDVYKILEDFNWRFKTEEMNRKWEVFSGPKDILQVIEERRKKLEKDSKKFLEGMQTEQEEFKDELEVLFETIMGFHMMNDINEHQKTNTDVTNINNQIVTFILKARKFNERENLFEMPMTDYEKLKTMQKEFVPYSHLWSTVHGWELGKDSWVNDPFEQVDALYAQKFVEDGIKHLSQVLKFTKERGIPIIEGIANKVKKEMDEFKPKVPLLVALRNKGMTGRHWKEISVKAGFQQDIVPTAGDFTFKKILDLGLMEHVEYIVEVGDKAGKEFAIETKLDEMQTRWEDITFVFMSYLPQPKNTYIIKNYDDITQILDEDIVSTQGMLFSPFKKPFEERLDKWNNSLQTVSNILEEWAKLQGQWMYLQPIFDSQDIAKQLPGETKKFKQVDQGWRNTLAAAFTQKKVIKVCEEEGLCDKLKDFNKNLEHIQKELEKYLESKREKFSRFYFLSNDDLLEILSETKEPSKVQPHLKKVFENVHEIEFDANKRIVAMFSAEKERVGFFKNVDPQRKNVEDWMGEVERMMKLSVRQCIFQGIATYKPETRVQWSKSNPGQCVLNGSQKHWTKEVEDAIMETTPGYGTREYFIQLKSQLDDLVELVQEPLTKQQQVTINALIVIDVHAKDVVEKLLDQKIKDINEFEWISQLRYYWEMDGTGEEQLRCKCIQTDYPYGYEYLGNTLRLVITPLTDKCYMTLMGALKLNLGGAPAGPAGTGKTETTKDLAKALAKQCVVFNCSDTMDYIMVGKFFKGLASAGAWCCFDEFNRINIEVLSVIAQQLLQLFDAKARFIPQIEFEGSNIKINSYFSVFITMNPGYAGRTELPDNLKALFRGVAMMVPDYALIGEIMLYSFGFKKGRELAQKMVQTFKLSSEQLSSQDHYDYGMRAVRSVINAAGLLKSQYRQMDEDQLLLRALRDVNCPKFLKDDIPLFENIISDLFPGIDRPKQEYGNLLSAIKKCCESEQFNLQPEKSFVDKVFQLYDTIQVRHGLMLVGPTGGGKTCNYKVLQAALTALKDDDPPFYKVNTYILNPKSITMGQLYGYFNEQTHEWFDGILANIIRETVKDQSAERQWIQFDGPVDAIWIESMNTVLDDNKKLCLNSGQILTLTPYMTMMFEVEDLAVASPATVSRCGMVYMEPVSLGTRPLIKSWILSISENIRKKTKIEKMLQDLFDKYLDSTIEQMRLTCKEIIPSFDNNLAQSCCRLMEFFLKDYSETEFKRVQQEELDNLQTMIQSIFYFSFIWSVMATVDYDSRGKLNVYFRQIIKSDVQIPIPEDKSIYDYFFNTQTKEFVEWSHKYKDFEIEQRLQYHEIVVPTNDSTRNIYIKKILLSMKHHVMCVGPTGTGKSQNSYQLLTMDMGEDYQYIALTFSAQTGANQTQDTIDLKMDKRRKGVYGPPIGKRCIIFVDDINMPKKEEYGAQPPIELLRQFLDHQGWYNRRELTFMKLDDIILLAAMGPPGGGRNSVTNRLVRHFNILAYPELDRDIINQIFQVMVKNFFKRYNDQVKGLIPVMVESVLDVYYKVRNDLLPTPSKSHYTFNLRDIYRVLQGFCSSHPKHGNDIVTLSKLWFHENMRVFHDRLTTDEDREYFKQTLYTFFEKFGTDKDSVMNQERIIFADFLQGKDAEPKIYGPVDDLGIYINKMDSFQDEYNSDPSFTAGGKKLMKLVMFLDACEHIARISRILRQPMGNALLFGVGGSGRQSLSKIATFLSNFKMFQIEVVKNYTMRSWRDDCKKALMIAGVENKPVSFIFVDTQIINEQMLEDINNILNSGDVTGIYQEKDMEDIMNACKNECIKKGLTANKMNIFTQYLGRVKKNIHIILAMSPIGEAFQVRLRMFPSLINCCTIDWFSEWPEEALQGVGVGQLIDQEEELKIQGKIDTLVNMFKQSHKSVELVSKRYLQELRRYNYVTPTSYLELLNLFKQILHDKNQEVEKNIGRLQNGLQKLRDANEAVALMKVQLTEKQPKLAEVLKECEVVMEELTVQNAQAQQKQILVAKEEKEANIKKMEAQKIADEAEASVAEAQRSLEITLEKVKLLKKTHLDEVRALMNPPKVIITVLSSVVILNTDYIKEKGSIVMKAVEGSIGKKTEDYFKTAQLYLLSDTNALLSMLQSYRKDDINPKYIKKMEEVCISQPDFNDQKAMSANQATGYLFLWAKCMYDYYTVFTQTQPLRNKLEEMRQIVAQKEEELKVKQAELNEINQKISISEERKRKKIEEKENLNTEIKNCEIQLERAKKLTEGLSDEKERWTNDVERLKLTQELVPGNSALAASMLAYSGPFNAQYRTELEQGWLKKLTELNIPHTDNITMRQFLGNDVKIQQWNINYLPKDGTSIENGIIIDCSRRWPLMIDPQYQANKYIKSMGKEFEIKVMKVSDIQLMRNLEWAIGQGTWVLIEGVGRELDPSLEPILLQQVVRQGNSQTIQIGDKTLNYSEGFKFFMTTTMSNPHYSPETSVKVTIINFGITKFGLEEQMLAKIVELEQPMLENRKIEIVRKNAQDNKTLFSLEESILKQLSEQKGEISDILKNESLINSLQDSKKTAAEIKQRVQDSKVTEIEIDKAREGYRPVAYRISLLYFCILELSVIDPMYQYSLQWFINLFVKGVEDAEQSKELSERLQNLNNHFTYSLYENVCRSLFEKHKLLFSFLLAQQILEGDHKMNMNEWRFLLSGSSGDIEIPKNPTNWISDTSWTDIYRNVYGSAQLEKLKGFEVYFLENIELFQEFYDSNNPQERPIPGPWNEQLDEFEKIIVLKSIRPDKLIPAVQTWVKNNMGIQFIKVPIFDLEKCFADSTVFTPLIFVLSTGSDPKADFIKFADEKGFARKNKIISLGQGQGPKAEKLIREASNLSPGWVLLQNCHLAVSWISELERIVQELDDNCHKDFRLWLTSMPSPDFPTSVLQNGVKMTIEPPQGLRQNLMRSYNSFNDQQLIDCKQPEAFRQLLFGVCLFHAIIQDRRKFGSIGWNIPYEFTNEDLAVTIKQLKTLLDEYAQIPYKVLNFIGAEINYGGRVTDDKDVRLIKTILRVYCNKDVLKEKYIFSASGIYYQPPVGLKQDYLNYIDQLPLNPSPEAFGLHENAEITNSQNETRILLETLQSIQPRAASGSGKSREQLIEEIASVIEKQTPPAWIVEQIAKKYPTDYNESMNTVLVQELIRYNRLLKVMAISLVQVKKALKGLIVMSDDLEKLSTALYDNQVPKMWSSIGHLSLKPLSSWINDLKERVSFLTTWIENGTPKVFWISGFHFPQAFITGSLQNFARSKKIPIDKLVMEYIIRDDLTPETVKEKPESGVYVYGIFIEGARWDYKRKCITQPKPKELYSDLPIIHLQPYAKEEKEVKSDSNLDCPLYKVVSRAGTLMTTGHSTNFVMYMDLPMVKKDKDKEESKKELEKKRDEWIRAGVATFLSLRY